MAPFAYLPKTQIRSCEMVRPSMGESSLAAGGMRHGPADHQVTHESRGCRALLALRPECVLFVSSVSRCGSHIGAGMRRLQPVTTVIVLAEDVTAWLFSRLLH